MSGGLMTNPPSCKPREPSHVVKWGLLGVELPTQTSSRFQRNTSAQTNSSTHYDQCFPVSRLKRRCESELWHRKREHTFEKGYFLFSFLTDLSERSVYMLQLNLFQLIIIVICLCGLVEIMWLLLLLRKAEVHFINWPVDDRPGC